jgi:hypothetical protein
MAEVTQMARLPERLYHYRIHDASVSVTRRAQQLRNMAIAMEKTIERRSPVGAQSDMLRARTAQWYAEAAGLYFASNELQLSEDNLTKALRAWPRFFDADETELALAPTEAGRGIVNAAFQSVTGPKLHTIHNRFMSALFMREVFAGLKSGNFEQIDTYLWPGIFNNPLWLRNRGVVSLLIKNILWRTGRVLRGSGN